MSTRQGRVLTFYSFKGGIGRSMAAASVAVLLSRLGHKVMLIDWDLEAPGLERYFVPYQANLMSSVESRLGMLDLILEPETLVEGGWREAKSIIQTGTSTLAIISAGKRDESYARRLQGLDWGDLFENHDFGNRLEAFRSELLAEFDYVIIDSRTGLSDAGGICTIHLPDLIVLFLHQNDSSLYGALDVVKGARKAHSQLPFDRGKLLVVPVIGRSNATTEREQSIAWRRKIASATKDLFDDWLPATERVDTAVAWLTIPDVPYWSFSERIPAREEDSQDPASITSAHSFLANLISNDFDWSSTKTSSSPDQPSDQAASAAETVKSLIPDPRDRIRLRDFLLSQARAVAMDLEDDRFPIQGVEFTPPEAARRIRDYEQATSALAGLFAVGGFWSERDQQEYWRAALGVVVNRARSHTGLVTWLRLGDYPALILLYAGGITAVARNDFGFLRSLAIDAEYRDLNRSDPLITRVHTGRDPLGDMFQAALHEGDAQLHTPVSDRLFDFLRDPIVDLIGEATLYETAFDRFEYLLGLLLIDQSEHDWAPPGRFAWKFPGERAKAVDWVEAEMSESPARSIWPPLQAGLFGGDASRVAAAIEAYQQTLRRFW